MSKGQRASGPQQLRRYLKKSRLTQAALAAELGIADSTLSEILTCRAYPSLQLAVRLENLTGIPAREFAEKAA